MQQRIRTLLICLSVASLSGLALSGLSMQSARASGGETPGTSASYDFDAAAIDGYTFDSTLVKSPGDANVFWASQFSATNGRSGYFGMQTGASDDGVFLVSVWGATTAKVGSAGSTCQTFSEDGTGYSCRIYGAHPIEGHTYANRVEIDDQGWITASIRDTTAGRDYVLGSLQTPAGTKIKGDWVSNWTEYFDWNSPLARCNDAAYSEMLSTSPASIDPVTPRTARLLQVGTSSTCSSDSRVPHIGDTIMQGNGVGNSSAGSISSHGKCLDFTGLAAQDIAITTEACSHSVAQKWVHSRDLELRTTFLCLDARGETEGSGVTMWTCNGGASQKWTFDSDGTIRNAPSGLALDLGSGAAKLGAVADSWSWKVPA